MKQADSVSPYLHLIFAHLFLLNIRVAEFLLTHKHLCKPSGQIFLVLTILPEFGGFIWNLSLALAILKQTGVWSVA